QRVAQLEGGGSAGDPGSDDDDVAHRSTSIPCSSRSGERTMLERARICKIRSKCSPTVPSLGYEEFQDRPSRTSTYRVLGRVEVSPSSSCFRAPLRRAGIACAARRDTSRSRSAAQRSRLRGALSPRPWASSIADDEVR